MPLGDHVRPLRMSCGHREGTQTFGRWPAFIEQVDRSSGDRQAPSLGPSRRIGAIRSEPSHGRSLKLIAQAVVG